MNMTSVLLYLKLYVYVCACIKATRFYPIKIGMAVDHKFDKEGSTKGLSLIFQLSD